MSDDNNIKDAEEESNSIPKKRVIMIGSICAVCTAILVFCLVFFGLKRINELEQKLTKAAFEISALTTEKGRIQLNLENEKKNLESTREDLKKKSDELEKANKNLSLIRKECRLSRSKTTAAQNTIPDEAILKRNKIRNTYDAAYSQYIVLGRGIRAADGSNKKIMDKFMRLAGLMDKKGELLRVKESFVKKGAALILNFNELNDLISMELFFKEGDEWKLGQTMDLNNYAGYIGNQKQMPAYFEKVKSNK